MKKLFSYENGLLIMMSLCNGIVALDRLAVNFLAKPIKDEFHLSNAQIGLLSSALSIVIAGSGFFLARMADKTRARKQMLLATLVLFSLLSAVTGMAVSFATLIAARMVLGMAEGPILPVAQSVMAIESTPRRRGLNMGIMQNLGAALIGVTLGPIVFTQLAAHFGWRPAFYLSCLPGLLLAGVIFIWMRPLRQEAPAGTPGIDSAASLWAVLKSRNVVLCIAISGLFSGWLLVQNSFLTLYLQTHDGLSLTAAGGLIGLTGLAQIISGTVMPAISDRIGRKPALIVVTTFGIVAPIVTLFVPAVGPWLAVSLFIGWFGGGAGPLFISIIPTESVPARYVATAVAVSLASGEIFGGVIGPPLAGQAADVFGPSAPFWICAGAAAICGVLSQFLVETAPSKTAGAA